LTNELTKEDTRDEDILEEDEASSAGLSGVPIHASLTIVSVTSSTKIVVFQAGAVLRFPRVQENDMLLITGGDAGSTDAYTVDEVIDNVTLRVKELISDADSGSGDVYYRPGALVTGFDPNRGLASLPLTKENVQEVIEELTAMISNGLTLADFHKFDLDAAEIIEIPDKYQYLIHTPLKLTNTSCVIVNDNAALVVE